MSGELEAYDPTGIGARRFRQRKDHWKKFFEVSSKDKAARHLSSAINELDGLWAQRGLMGIGGIISGEGLWTETVSEAEITDDDNVRIALPQQNLYTVVRHGSVINRWALSQGIGWVSFLGSDRPKLSYQFTAREGHGRNDAYADYSIAHHIQIKLGTLSLLPIRSIELGLHPLHDRFAPQATLN
jgi:hypothetical protein